MVGRERDRGLSMRDFRFNLVSFWKHSESFHSELCFHIRRHFGESPAQNPCQPFPAPALAVQAIWWDRRLGKVGGSEGSTSNLKSLGAAET